MTSEFETWVLTPFQGMHHAWVQFCGREPLHGPQLQLYCLFFFRMESLPLCPVTSRYVFLSVLVLEACCLGTETYRLGSDLGKTDQCTQASSPANCQPIELQS